MNQREDELDPALKAKGEAALARLEAQLATRRFLVGEAFTLADVALVAYTRVAPRGGFDLAQYPSIRAWIGRVERELRLDSATV